MNTLVQKLQALLVENKIQDIIQLDGEMKKVRQYSEGEDKTVITYDIEQLNKLKWLGLKIKEIFKNTPSASLTDAEENKVKDYLDFLFRLCKHIQYLAISLYSVLLGNPISSLIVNPLVTWFKNNETGGYTVEQQVDQNIFDHFEQIILTEKYEKKDIYINITIKNYESNTQTLNEYLKSITSDQTLFVDDKKDKIEKLIRLYANLYHNARQKKFFCRNFKTEDLLVTIDINKNPIDIKFINYKGSAIFDSKKPFLYLYNYEYIYSLYIDKFMPRKFFPKIYSDDLKIFVSIGVKTDINSTRPFSVDFNHAIRYFITTHTKDLISAGQFHIVKGLNLHFMKFSSVIDERPNDDTPLKLLEYCGI
jgi:hypothetical protein